MRHGLVASLLVLAFASSGIGQEPALKKARSSRPAGDEGYEVPAKLAQEAMDGLKTGGIPGFMDVVYSEKPRCLKKEDRASFELTFRRGHDAIAIRYGKPLGKNEFVRTDVVGQSLVRFVYIEKLERVALLWHLIFYRGESGEWRWVGFNMTGLLDKDFQAVKKDAVDKDALAMAQDAIDQLRDGGVAKLFDLAFDPNKTEIVADRPSMEAAFTKKRETTVAQVGKSLGQFELIRAEAIGPSVVRFVYIEKYQGEVLVWRLSFYRGVREWKWRDLSVGGYQDEFTTKP